MKIRPIVLVLIGIRIFQDLAMLVNVFTPSHRLILWHVQ